MELLEDTFGCLMWYSFAVHEAPKYTAEAFNPDIHECQWLGMQPDPDPMHIARECLYQKLRKFPPLEDYAPTVGCHSLVDPSFAPPGKHVVQNEQLGPPASAHTEAEWLEIKKRYADELMSLWQDYAPNMTWDNVIGVDTNTAFDHTRMKNLGPNGTMAGVDRPPHQVVENRPTPELANHRTPIETTLRHRRILARRFERRIVGVVQLLQDHRQGPGARQTLGGAGQGRAGLPGRAAENRAQAGAGLAARGGLMAQSYDVIIIGSGPNGLAIGAYLSRAGQRVLLLEKRFEAGGGLATEQVTLPEYYHNTHAIYKMMVDYAPVYRDFALEETYGVEHIQPEVQVAMPFEDGRCLCIHRDVEKTCQSIAEFSPKDAESYRAMHHRFDEMMKHILGPQTYVPMEGALDQAAKAEMTELGREVSAYAEKTPQDIVCDLFENDQVRTLMLYMACHWGLEYDAGWRQLHGSHLPEPDGELPAHRGRLPPRLQCAAQVHLRAPGPDPDGRPDRADSRRRAERLGAWCWRTAPSCWPRRRW